MAAENEVQVWGERAIAESGPRAPSPRSRASRRSTPATRPIASSRASMRPRAARPSRSTTRRARCSPMPMPAGRRAAGSSTRPRESFAAHGTSMCARVPADAELAPLIARVGWQHVEIDEQRRAPRERRHAARLRRIRQGVRRRSRGTRPEGIRRRERDGEPRRRPRDRRAAAGRACLARGHSPPATGRA